MIFRHLSDSKKHQRVFNTTRDQALCFISRRKHQNVVHASLSITIYFHCEWDIWYLQRNWILGLHEIALFCSTTKTLIFVSFWELVWDVWIVLSDNSPYGFVISPSWSHSFPNTKQNIKTKKKKKKEGWFSYSCGYVRQKECCEFFFFLLGWQEVLKHNKQGRSEVCFKTWR